jgi:hypothetical protein
LAVQVEGKLTLQQDGLDMLLKQRLVKLEVLCFNKMYCGMRRNAFVV